MNPQEITNQIKKYIYDFGPQKAADLVNRFKNSGISLNKKKINPLLYHNNEFEKCELTHKWEIKNRKPTNDIDSNSGSTLINENDITKFEKLAATHTENLITYQSYYSIPEDKRKEYKSDLINAKKHLDTSKKKLINFIITTNFPLSYIEASKFISSEFYRVIINNDKIKDWIKTKQGDKEINNLSEDEKHKEYEVLAIKAWEDGIITKEEEENLKLLQKKNGLNERIANEIFEKVKAEYFAKKKLINNPSNTIEKKINDRKFIIKKAKLPFQPLFMHKFNNKTGDAEITINLVNDLYNKESESLIISMACAIYSAKNSMTSPEISIFIDRIHHNLKLIE